MLVVNATPAALFRLVAHRRDHTYHPVDEIDIVFGTKAEG